MSERKTPSQEQYNYIDSFVDIGAGDYRPVANTGQGLGQFIAAPAPGTISSVQVTQSGLVRWLFEVSLGGLGAGVVQGFTFGSWGGPLGGRGTDAAAMTSRFKAGNLLLQSIYATWGDSGYTGGNTSDGVLSPDCTSAEIGLDIQTGGGPAWTNAWKWSGDITVDPTFGAIGSYGETNNGFKTGEGYNMLPVIIGPLTYNPVPAPRLMRVYIKNKLGGATTDGGTFRFIVTGTEM